MNGTNIFSDLFYFLNKNSEHKNELVSRKYNRIPAEVQNRVRKEKIGNNLFHRQ